MISKETLKNVAFPLLLIVAVLIYSFSGSSIGISLDFGEDALHISAADLDWALSYDQISSLALTDLPDVGQLKEGIQQKRLQCGSWENETWGEYTLCIDPRVDRCIVLTMDSGDTYVINYENSNSTEQLHTMFSELLRSKGFQ